MIIDNKKGQISKRKKGNQDKFNYILNSNKLQFYYGKGNDFFLLFVIETSWFRTKNKNSNFFLYYNQSDEWVIVVETAFHQLSLILQFFFFYIIVVVVLIIML